MYKVYLNTFGELTEDKIKEIVGHDKIAKYKEDSV